MALRDATELFAEEFQECLEQVGRKRPKISNDLSFQLMKFERLNPDVFVWLLRDNNTYIVTISDRPNGHPGIDFLAHQWLKDKVTPAQILTLTDTYLVNDSDTIVIHQLPDNFDLDMEDLYDAS